MLPASWVCDHPDIKDLNAEGGDFYLKQRGQSECCVYARHRGDSRGPVPARRAVQQACITHSAQKGKVGALPA